MLQFYAAGRVRKLGRLRKHQVFPAAGGRSVDAGACIAGISASLGVGLAFERANSLHGWAACQT